jgi:hypothetical protein
MERIREHLTKWTEGRSPAEVAALVAGAIAIAVVPGALVVWLGWRVLRTRGLAYLRP